MTSIDLASNSALLQVAEKLAEQNALLGKVAIRGESAFIRYSAYADGTDFTETWSAGQNYIGHATGLEAPENKEGYTWSLFASNIRETLTVTLKKNDWLNNTQIIETVQLGETGSVFPSPKPESQEAYLEAGIVISAATDNALVFTCLEVPEIDLVVDIQVTEPLAVIGGTGVSSWNELLDKPFGEKIVSLGDTLTWDGVIDESSITVEGDNGVILYHVHSAVPTTEQLVGSTLVTSLAGEDTSVEITADSIVSIPNGIYVAGNAKNIIYLCSEDNTELNGITFPKKGIYFIYANQDGASMYSKSLTIPNYEFTTTVVKKIDEKYLPEIAREKLSADVQESLNKADTALQSFTEEDPTVPAWAKEATKPSYTADEVGALPVAHNTAADAHNDIRILVTELTNRLNALANSDDTTLDQLSEIVAYIKANKELIDSITTDKVNVADIIDNLTTNVANKPLSAAQGVALKELLDAVTAKLEELEADLENDISWNDLEDKPFGEERVESQVIIEYDGLTDDKTTAEAFLNSDGSQTANGYFVKVSELTPSASDLVGAIVRGGGVQGTDYETDALPLECIKDYKDDNNYAVIDIPHSTEGSYMYAAFIIAYDEVDVTYSVTIDSSAKDMVCHIPSAGIWAQLDAEGSYSSYLSYNSTITTIKTLDPKYLPDDIANKADLQVLQNALDAYITDINALIGGDE